jgi:hypothetical protein
LLEKDEFVRRLADARVKGVTKPPPEAEPAPSAASAGPSASGQAEPAGAQKEVSWGRCEATLSVSAVG